jgi:hypothetical protein
MEEPMRKPVQLTSKDRKMGVERLRFEARCAYLDGRNARAKELNRKADALYREAFVTVRDNMSLDDLDALQASFP